QPGIYQYADVPMSILDGSNGFVVEGHAAQDDLGYYVKGAGDVNLELEECPTPLFMENVTGSNGFALRAPYGEGAFSGDVSNAGDINNDGIDDIIVTIIQHRTDVDFSIREGDAYVVYGTTEAFPSIYDLLNLTDDAKGFRITSDTDEFLDVDHIGDFNGDGIDDIILSEYNSTHVIFGQSTNFPSIFNVSSLDGTNGFTIGSG